MAFPRFLIALHSRSGVTERLATAITDKAREAGAEGRLRRAREVIGPEVMALAPGWPEGAYEASSVSRNQSRGRRPRRTSRWRFQVRRVTAIARVLKDAVISTTKAGAAEQVGA